MVFIVLKSLFQSTEKFDPDEHLCKECYMGIEKIDILNCQEYYPSGDYKCEKFVNKEDYICNDYFVGAEVEFCADYRLKLKESNIFPSSKDEGI